jgi:hypothetical protein
LNDKLAVENLAGIHRETEGKFESFKESIIRLINHFVVNLYIDSESLLILNLEESIAKFRLEI